MAEGSTLQTGDRQATGSPRTLARFAPVALVLVCLAGAYAAGLQRYLSLDYLAQSQDVLRGWVAAHPMLAPAAFFAGYAVAVAVAFPAASVLTIFGGFLFGVAEASALVALAATLGATVLFLAARTAFGDVLRRRFGERAKMLANGFEEGAFGYLLVLRLAPVFPFVLVNVAPALFNVPLRTYVAATFIGILPGVVAYCWLGQGLGSVLTAARDAGRDVSLSELATPQITAALLALAVVAAIPPVVKAWRRRRGAARGE